MSFVSILASCIVFLNTVSVVRKRRDRSSGADDVPVRGGGGGGSDCDKDMALRLSCLFSMIHDDHEEDDEDDDGGCYHYSGCCRLYGIRSALSASEPEPEPEPEPVSDEIGAEFAVVALTPAAAVISIAAVTATAAAAAADVNSTVVSYSSSFVHVDPKTLIRTEATKVAAAQFLH